MNKQNIVTGLAVLALILAVVAFSKAGPGAPGRNGQNGESFGATAGADSFSPYDSRNGVVSQYRSAGFYTATSTLCTFQTGSATSTLEYFTAMPSAATSTSVLVVLEKTGSNPFPPVYSAASTTNQFANATIAANATSEFVYTATSTAQVGRNDVFAPGTYLNFYAKNGGSGSIAQAFGGGSIFGGRCRAIFREL